MLHGGVWPATVIAKNCCELYAIDKQGLDHMLAIQPELQDMLGLPREPVPGRSGLGPLSNPIHRPPTLPPSTRYLRCLPLQPFTAHLATLPRMANTFPHAFPRLPHPVHVLELTPRCVSPSLRGAQGVAVRPGRQPAAAAVRPRGAGGRLPHHGPRAAAGPGGGHAAHHGPHDHGWAGWGVLAAGQTTVR